MKQIQFLPKDLAERQRLHARAKKAYYEGKPIMSDPLFDRLERGLEQEAPDTPSLHTTGYSVGKKVEKPLPFFLPSLRKVFYDDSRTLDNWVSKFAFDSQVFVMGKVDGNSVSIHWERGKPKRMFTRGDGEKGKDISYFLPYLSNALPQVKEVVTISLRCEIVLPRSVWQRKWSRYFDNPRNQVAGVLNRMDVHKSIHDFKVIVLENLSTTKPIREGLAVDARWAIPNINRFLPPHVDAQADALTPKRLSDLLKTFTKGPAAVDYDLDGLVLSSTTHQQDRAISDKPKSVIAWKLNDEADAVDAEVIDISWRVTRSNRVVPTAVLKPVRCGGVTVSSVSVGSAKLADERGIGPGAKIKLIRSGDVIPYIKDVTKPAKFPMPPRSVYGADAVAWDGAHLKIVPAFGAAAYRRGDDRADVKLDRLVRFIKGMEIDFAGVGVAERLIEAGIDTPEILMGVAADDLREVRGFKGASVNRLLASLDAVLRDTHFVGKVAAASGIFATGVGETWFRRIVDHTGPVAFSPSPIYEDLFDVPRLPSKVATNIVDNWAKFERFCDDCGLRYHADVKKPGQKSGPLSGAFVSFTGYRNADHEAAVAAAGAEVIPFGSKTTHLLINAGGKASSKIEKAEAKGVKVVTFEELRL